MADENFPRKKLLTINNYSKLLGFNCCLKDSCFKALKGSMGIILPINNQSFQCINSFNTIWSSNSYICSNFSSKRKELKLCLDLTRVGLCLKNYNLWTKNMLRINLAFGKNEPTWKIVIKFFFC